jgi:hypothetical protein
MAFQWLTEITFGRRHTITLAGIRLVLPNPNAQAVPAASNRLRDRQNCCRSAREFALVIQDHPHRSRAQFF